MRTPRVCGPGVREGRLCGLLGCVGRECVRGGGQEWQAIPRGCADCVMCEEGVGVHSWEGRCVQKGMLSGDAKGKGF